MNVDRKVNILIEIERLQIPDSCLASNDEESIRRSNSPIRARSRGSVDMWDRISCDSLKKVASA